MSISIRALAASVAAGVLLPSCQSTEEPKSDSTSAKLPEPRPSDYKVASGAGVEALVKLALEHHPSISAAEAKVRRHLAKVPQAKALPDPKARVSFGSMAETAAGRVDTMLGVEQALPFPGKLRAMAKAAGKEAEAAASSQQEEEPAAKRARTE